MVFFSYLAFGQDALTLPQMPVDVIAEPSAQELMSFLAALGGAKGLGVMGMVALGVQGAMLLLKSKLGELAGKYRLLIVMGLTLVSGVVAMKMQGMDWGSALLHSWSIGAFQVLFHQGYKQFWVKQS